jgi:hypothetical protein
MACLLLTPIGSSPIEPHALAHDGFRWQARSFVRAGLKPAPTGGERGEFRDFVLGPVLRARVAGPAQSKPDEDADWTSFVALVIAPHPGVRGRRMMNRKKTHPSPRRMRS